MNAKWYKECPLTQVSVHSRPPQTGLCVRVMTASSGTSTSAWIHADQAKGGKAIPVPLNSEALAVVREQIGRNPTVVFTFDGRPILQPNTKAWRKALVRAGIDDFRWHDLRHTWASWHVQAGTPLHVLQELGGWETPAMVRRYAHLAPEHLAEHAARISWSAPNPHHGKLTAIR